MFESLKNILNMWRKCLKDFLNVERFEVFLMREGYLEEQDVLSLREDAAAQVLASAKNADPVAPPSLETIFTDVYEDVPGHLRDQSDACIEHHASRGEGVNEMGEFPL